MYRRSESMIALRARREALQIARDVAYPRVEVPSPQASPYEDPPRAIPIPDYDPPPRVAWYELRPFFGVNAKSDLRAPWWIWWLMGACVMSIATAAYLIFHSI